MNKVTDKLIQELETRRSEIKTDNYPMSIGEAINLYKDKEIILNPAFQRLFRWSNDQKSKFIESILLGIPIPEIFVAQGKDGKWTIVDGVQRISTILQLLGELPNCEPLKLTEQKYLPSLKDLTWEQIPEDIHRIFKRSKLAFNIILTENDVMAQYELFQRLNTGGLHLEDQEIRNCLIIMLNKDFYEQLNILKEYPQFINTLQLSDRKIQEEYHMELILRYFIAVYREVNYQNYNISGIHLREFIDKETVELINDATFNLETATEEFKSVFNYINDLLGENAFKPYDKEREKFSGQFSNAIYEAISTGIAVNYKKLIKMKRDDVIALVKAIQSDDKFIEFTKHGVRSPIRFKNLTEFSNYQ